MLDREPFNVSKLGGGTTFSAITEAKIRMLRNVSTT